MNPRNPRLENWTITNGFMVGAVFEDDRFPSGKQIVTTLIQDIDFEKRSVKTTNTLYRLGKKYGEKDSVPETGTQGEDAQLRFVF